MCFVQILAWKENGGDDAVALWNSLAAANDAVKGIVGNLTQLATSLPAADYNAGIALCAQSSSDKVRSSSCAVLCSCIP